MNDKRLPAETAFHKYRDRTHSGAIEAVTRVPWAPVVPGEKNEFLRPLPPGIWIEVGSGCSTPAFAQARNHYRTGHDASLPITVDFNGEHVPPQGEFPFDALVGDSLEVLGELVRDWGPPWGDDENAVAFAFLDSAPDSMRTFREFQILEPFFAPGSIVLVDNALPPWIEPRLRITPCAKGFLLTSYLLSHPDWRVHPRPWWGDSMTWAELNPGGNHLTRKVRAFDLYQSEIEAAEQSPAPA